MDTLQTVKQALYLCLNWNQDSNILNSNAKVILFVISRLY